MVSIGPQWRDDATVVRGLGVAVAPGAGAVSVLLLWGARLLPLGNVAFRASLVAALALAGVGFLLFSLAHQALDQTRASPLNAWLALLASLAASLSPALLLESSVGGGATVALALALALLVCWFPGEGSQARSWLGLGAGLGLLLAESPVLAAAAILALVVQRGVLRSVLPERSVGLLAAGLGGGALLVLLPVLLRPLAPTSWVGIGLVHSFGEIRALDVLALRGRGLGAWMHQVGPIAFLLSCAGAVLGWLRPSLRGVAAPLLVPLVLDALIPARSSGLLTPDPLGALRMFSLCGASTLAVFAIQGVALFLWNLALPLVRPAGVLAVAFYAALVAAVAEEGSSQADRSRNAGAEAWTDQAFELLPPASLILARSDTILWRLWAARLASGMRPDITVVPSSFLSHGTLAGALLQEEPSLASLLRDISATGTPSEFSLSTVADVRPLFLEIDPQGDRKIASHTASESLWLRFAPQPYGPSDRRLGRTAATTAFYRVVGAARRNEPHDEATLEVLALHARNLAVASALLHDRDSTQLALDQLAALRRNPTPDDPLWDIIDPQRKAPLRGRHSRR
ncbi:MAG: hypothetical protein RMJ98_12245 [Myxococcales bacterium]|nr:hypothetical protein [Polyangiaceae bacterium]MDW8250058.1 hypothetical protein [Myxococcales bacterium]